MNCWTVVVKLASSNHSHVITFSFGMIYLRKVWIPLFLPYQPYAGYIITTVLLGRLSFKWTKKVNMQLNKETKPNPGSVLTFLPWINSHYFLPVGLLHSSYHLVMPSARISLTLSRHPSLLFIASGRSPGLHPLSSQSCWMLLLNGHV